MKSYNKKYQFLQIPGREINNKYLVNVEGKLSSSQPSQFVSNYREFDLPDRGRFEGVIVSKFSAIGGPEVAARGAQDKESESYSVYNSINNRNYIVRRKYDAWLRETSSHDDNNPSYHKVNKNGAKIGDFYKHDNWFVTHQIPRSDYGYSWITASVTSSITSSGLYSSIYKNLNIGNLGILTGAYENNIQLDFSGFNTFITKSMDTVTDTLTFINDDSGSLHKYLLKQNGPYGFPTWKQVRTGQTPQATYSRKNNKYKISVVQKLDTDTFSSSLEQYFESPVTKTSANIIKFKIPDTGHEIHLEAEKTSHTMNVSNKKLKERILKGNSNKKETGHDKLVKLHKENKKNKSRPSITRIEKLEKIFPAHEKFGFGKIRNKPNYTEVAGTGSNGYDRKSTVTRTFWKNSLQDRLQTNPFTAINKTGSFNALGFPETSGSFMFGQADTASTGVKIDFGGYIGNMWRAPLTYSFSLWPMEKKLDGAGSVVGYDVGLLGVPGGIRRISGDSPKLGALQTTPERYFYFFNQPSGTYSSSLVLDDTSNQYLVETFKYSPDIKYRVNPTLLFTYPANQPTYFGYGGSFFGLTVLKEYSMQYKTDIATGRTPFYDSYLQFASDIRPNSQDYSIVPEFKISKYMDYIVTASGGNFKSLDYIKQNNGYLDIEGRDEVATDVNNINVEQSISISSEMFDVFEEEFEEKNHRIHLTVNGIKKLLPYNGFYPQQRAVQLGDLFLQSTFGLKLGQNIEGFYETSNHNPSTMVSSFSNSVGGNGAPLDAQVQTVLQPFFAPGILFNTIKSGIAVDWLTVSINSASAAPYTAPPRYTASSRGFADISSSATYHGVAGKGNRLPDFYGAVGQSVYKELLWYLDRYISSSSDLNLRIPFEGIISLEEAIPQDFRDKILYLLGPEYYTFDTFPANYSNMYGGSNDRLSNIRNPSFNLKRLFGKRDALTTKDQRYKLAINNFLASSVEFFLEEGKLTSFRSYKQKDIPKFDTKKTYYMDVILRKDNDFSFIVNNMTSALASDPNFGLGQGRLFGPTTRFFIEESTFDPFNTQRSLQFDCAYAPWTPPYWFGKSIARISFKPTLPNHTINEIIQNSTVEYINPERDLRFIDDSNNVIVNNKNSPFYNKNYSSSPAYIHAMNLTSSINLGIIGNEKTIEYDESGIPLVIKEEPDASQNFWSIQTKFETPVLNFNNDLNKSLCDYKYSKEYTTFFSSSTVGIWSGYGEIPEQGKGIRIGLQESFRYSKSSTSASLLKHCGFEAGFKDIGKIEDQKEISEAIVLIPYTYRKNHKGELKEYAVTIPNVLGENGVYEKAEDLFGPYYFGVSKKVISELIDVEYDESTKHQIENLSVRTKQRSSITDTISKMLKYNIPPHLDWVNNKKIHPFVMYIFEFKSILSKQDLADIWQGLMPSLSYKVDKESVTIDHAFDKKEFFHGKRLPEDIKFKIFKVKKKAKVNYYSLTDSFVDDKKFSFNFSTTETVPNYSYNWPYDYFSLVEMVNVDAGIDIDTEE